jgi:hypothetical protein
MVECGVGTVDVGEDEATQILLVLVMWMGCMPPLH